MPVNLASHLLHFQWTHVKRITTDHYILCSQERMKTSLDALLLNEAGLFRLATGEADDDMFTRESDNCAIRKMNNDDRLPPNYQYLIRCRKSTPRHLPPIMTVQLPALMADLPEELSICPPCRNVHDIPITGCQLDDWNSSYDLPPQWERYEARVGNFDHIEEVD